MKASSLDGNLVEAHTTLGLIINYEYDFTGAEREYKRAIELNSNYTIAHQRWLAGIPASDDRRTTTG